MESDMQSGLPIHTRGAFSVEDEISRNQNGSLLIKFFRSIILASAILTGTSAASLAADTIAPRPEFQDQQRWRIIFSPYVWGASLNGSAGLLGRSTDVNIPFREILDNLDMSFMGNVDVGNGTVGFYRRAVRQDQPG